MAVACASAVIGTTSFARPTTTNSANANANAAAVETGQLAGADFRIDVPRDWNHELIVFFHGYAITPVAYEKTRTPSPMFAPMLAKGYAVAQSAYSQTGWAVEQGSADSERLRRYFTAHHGQPKRTFAMGMSMGGTLTVLALESQPQVYAGGLSLCGAIEPTDRLMQRDFALRAAFDYYFPDVLGPLVPAQPSPMPQQQVVHRIGEALRNNPRGVAALRGIYGTGDANTLPVVIAFITWSTAEMQRRTHGNPLDNSNLIYTGSGDDVALNAGVKRYRADSKAIRAMARWYVPTGKLTRPLLQLHDVDDPLVVASTAFEYALIAQRAGYGDNFVQQYVEASGHCVFNPEQIDQAFVAMTKWVGGGARPLAGRQP